MVKWLGVKCNPPPLIGVNTELLDQIKDTSAMKDIMKEINIDKLLPKSQMCVPNPTIPNMPCNGDIGNCVKKLEAVSLATPDIALAALDLPTPDYSLPPTQFNISQFPNITWNFSIATPAVPPIALEPANLRVTTFLAAPIKAIYTEGKNDSTADAYTQAVYAENLRQERIAKNDFSADEDDGIARAFVTELLNNVELSSNLYILYIILITLFLNFPVQVYGSSKKVRAKRAFALSQGQFVVIVVILLYMQMYAGYFLSLPWAQMIWNMQVDICYANPEFIADIGKAVGTACAEIGLLRASYIQIQAKVQKQYLASESWMVAKSYKDLQTQFEGLPQNFGFQEAYTYSRLDFMGVCEPRELSEYYQNAQQSLSSPLWVLISSGVLAQMAAKFILTEFGRSATYLLDPLAFHNGLGEVADHQSSPDAVDVTKFLKSTKYTGFMILSVPTVVCVVNLCITAFNNLEYRDTFEQDTESVDVWSGVLVIACQIIVIVLYIITAKYLFVRFRSGLFDADTVLANDNRIEIGKGACPCPNTLHPWPHVCMCPWFAAFWWLLAHLPAPADECTSRCA